VGKAFLTRDIMGSQAYAFLSPPAKILVFEANNYNFGNISVCESIGVWSINTFLILYLAILLQ